MSVSPREKEPVAVAIPVAAECRPCTDHHATVARKAHASEDKVRRAVADARAVRAVAGKAGVPQEHIAQIAKLAAFIKGRAASHAEKLAGITEEEVS